MPSNDIHVGLVGTKSNIERLLVETCGRENLVGDLHMSRAVPWEPEDRRYVNEVTRRVRGEDWP